MPPKAGCTTLQRFYLALVKDDGNYINHTTGEYFNKESRYTSNSVYKAIPRMTTGPVMERVYHDKNWIKGLNVRHPFERLYSGWKDKFNQTGADAWIFKRKYEKAILGYEKVESRLSDI